MFKLFPQGPRFLILFSQGISGLLNDLLVAAVTVFYFHHFYMELDNLEMDTQLNVLFFFLSFKDQSGKPPPPPPKTCIISCFWKSKHRIKTTILVVVGKILYIICRMQHLFFFNLHCIFFSWTHREKNRFCFFPGKNPIRKCVPWCHSD